MKLSAKSTTIIILVLFAILSLVVSYKALLSGGIYLYRDEWASIDLQNFRDYFFHIEKNDYMNLDFQKRIVETWILFFINYDTLGRVQFTILAFATLVSAFYVAGKLIDRENREGTIGQLKRNLIATSTALVYLINPINTQLFPSLYPSINYALFPLFFYFLYRAIVDYELRSALISGLIAGFMFRTVIHTLIYLPIAFFAAGLLIFRKPIRLKDLAKSIAVFSLAFFFLTSFILFPSLIALQTRPLDGVFSLNTEMLDFFSSVAALPGSMLMDFHVFWWPYVGYAYPFGDLFFPISALFCGALLVFGIWDRNDWSIMALAALGALFLFSKGSQPPFAFIYQFINFRFPMGWLLRVPMKFNHLIPFFYSILFLRLLMTIATNTGKLICAIGLSVIILSVFSWPFFSGDMAGALSKMNLSGQIADLQSMNSILQQGNPTLLYYGLDYNGVDSDILRRSTFLGGQLQDYNTTGNWSGLRIAPAIGAQYLLVNTANAPIVGGYFPMVYNGTHYFLFKLKDNSSQISVASDAYLCYCSSDTAGSLLREPPLNQTPDVLEFPYAAPTFPLAHLLAADTIVLDSSPLVFPYLNSSGIVAFYPSTLMASENSGWARIDLDPLQPGDFDFGKGFAGTLADPTVSDTLYLDQLSLDNLNFSSHDNLTTLDGNGSLYTAYSPSLASSLTVSPLNLTGPSIYELKLAAEGSGNGNVTLTIIARDASGNIVSIVPVLDLDGYFVQNKSLQFYIPSNTSGSTLYISTSTPNPGSTYTLRLDSFSIRKVTPIIKTPTISSTFTVPVDANYDVYLRYSVGRSGGNLKAMVDNISTANITTRAQSEHLVWSPIYQGELSAGAHRISIEQLGGNNLVNIAYVQRSDALPSELDVLANKTIIYRLLASADFDGTESNTGQPRKISAPISSYLNVPFAGEYSISYSIDGSANVTVDGIETNGTTYLSHGDHVLTIAPLNKHLSVDQVTLLRAMPKVAGNAQLVNFTRVDPSTYSVLVNSSRPYFLVLGRAYDPAWIVILNGTTYRPVASYGAVNAYVVNATGLNSVTIEFEAQNYFYFGAAIGILGLIALALYVHVSEKRGLPGRTQRQSSRVS